MDLNEDRMSIGDFFFGMADLSIFIFVTLEKMAKQGGH
jgi:hypothetical protein